MLLNVGGQIRPIEIKSGTTYRNDYFKQLDWFSKTADVPLFQPTVIYGGEDSQPIGDHFLMSWREVGSLVA
ncbi:MAG: hypothetical protein ACE362_20615 [Phaeodactylibacter xiamenensis]|uniref:DUF4143 domain-containing protein n=1 Tax=Phaeodactylibacter xiamenensis TaxID=1524460 RepID=A0A098SCB3_9BACT|nr:hypothetical protein [Phaeodactylibacter xiamenensis]KGE89293.1 hypothetical protein IX84_02870 [Phaeodactylibacter xiamenensis]MCR9055090.1 hypothetical protein [bacterium]